MEGQKQTNAYREHMEKVYKKVEGILKEDFDGLYAYFTKIFKEECDYIILMSRRCQVLYQLFEMISEYDGRAMYTKGLILSDKALPFYWDRIKDGSKIAIVDDIIVHGRTISEIYDVVSNLGKNIDVRLFGYMAEQEIDCISDEARERLTVSYSASTNEWRKLSGKIVDCIQVSNVPYTSFVNSFFQYRADAILSKIKEKTDLLKIEMTNGVQNAQKQCAYFVYEQNWEKPSILSSLSLGECIRVYWNEQTEKLTAIPYVFIRSMRVGEADKVFRAVAQALPEGFANIKKMFAKESRVEKLDQSLKEYKMRLLTCILSNYYWDVFCDRYDLSKPEASDMNTLRESFGESVVEELCSIQRDNIDELLRLSFLFEQDSAADLSETESLLEETAQVQKSGWIRRFFFKTWLNDEKRAEEKKERAQGITVDYLLKVAANIGNEAHETLARLVNNWDIGIVTANFSLDRKRNIIGCCNTPGEQSYKIILENNPIVMSTLLIASCMITKGDAKKADMPYEEYREQELIKRLDQFHDKKHLDDYAEIEQIIRRSKGYLNAWDQPQILNCDMREYKSIDDVIERYM